MMFGRAEPWPPRLEPDEAVLLEGRSSKRKVWRRMALSTAAILPGGLLLKLVLNEIRAPEGGGGLTLGDAISTTVMLIVVNAIGHLWALRRPGWMLTTRRFFRQGEGFMSRSEIGAVTLTGFGRVVVRPKGEGPIYQPSFWLDFLDDPAATRDALDRLR